MQSMQSMQSMQQGRNTDYRYNAIPNDGKATLKVRRRRRLSLTALCSGLLLPYFLFLTVFAMTTFSVHHTAAWLTYLYLGVTLVVVLVFGGLALNAVLRGGDPAVYRDPSWFLFIFFTGLIAWIVGLCAGEWLFWHNTEPAYDIQALDVYRDVDPGTASGKRMMDVGRISFKEGSHLDLDKAVGFKNNDWYCVAPVAVGTGTMQNYDFWAVGLNCCSDTQGSFKCGSYDDTNARSGLRMMRSDQRDFFRLAVQEAKVTYNIQSDYPLFFYWLEDPDAELNNYFHESLQFYGLGCLTFGGFMLFAITGAVVLFSSTV